MVVSKGTGLTPTATPPSGFPSWEFGRGGGGEGIFVASVTLPISSLELCACDL